MAAVVLNYINRLSFFTMKEYVTDAVIKQLQAAAEQKAQPIEMAHLQTVTTCKCCGWKGKYGQAQKNYFFHAPISELEFFCPKCSTYLGFITDVPENYNGE
jgi:hypothetical protein